MGLENPLHIVIILAVILMLFGAKRLPEMGRGLGSGIRGFRDGLANGPETAAVTETAVTPMAATEVAEAPVVAERELVTAVDPA